MDIRLRSPYGWMMIEPQSGALPDEFPYLRKKLIPLDEKNKVAEFGPGIRIPIRPFFGNLGVAPAMGILNSAPPSYNAGNLDNKWLVAGTKLFIAVQAPGSAVRSRRWARGRGRRRSLPDRGGNKFNRRIPVHGKKEHEAALAARGDPYPHHHDGSSRKPGRGRAPRAAERDDRLPDNDARYVARRCLYAHQRRSGLARHAGSGWRQGCPCGDAAKGDLPDLANEPPDVLFAGCSNLCAARLNEQEDSRSPCWVQDTLMR